MYDALLADATGEVWCRAVLQDLLQELHGSYYARVAPGGVGPGLAPLLPEVAQWQARLPQAAYPAELAPVLPLLVRAVAAVAAGRSSSGDEGAGLWRRLRLVETTLAPAIPALTTPPPLYHLLGLQGVLRRPVPVMALALGTATTNRLRRVDIATVNSLVTWPVSTLRVQGRCGPQSIQALLTRLPAWWQSAAGAGLLAEDSGIAVKSTAGWDRAALPAWEPRTAHRLLAALGRVPASAQAAVLAAVEQWVDGPPTAPSWDSGGATPGTLLGGAGGD